MNHTNIPDKILTDAAFRHNVSASLKSLHGLAFDVLVYVLGPQRARDALNGTPCPCQAEAARTDELIERGFGK
jgi:hypothetical protein